METTYDPYGSSDLPSDIWYKAEGTGGPSDRGGDPCSIPVRPPRPGSYSELLGNVDKDLPLPGELYGDIDKNLPLPDEKERVE